MNGEALRTDAASADVCFVRIPPVHIRSHHGITACRAWWVREVRVRPRCSCSVSKPRTLEVAIPLFAGMTAATGRKLKKLLSVVSTLVPFKPNMSSLSRQLQVSRNVIEEYLLYLEKAGMIA